MKVQEFVRAEMRLHFQEYPPTFIPLEFVERFPRWRNDIEEIEWTSEMNNAFVEDLLAFLAVKAE